jgi:hypothetical protein
MSEKYVQTRVIQKHDLEENWQNADDFIPLLGEIIIYDPDTNHALPRIKIGDGITTAHNLPFLINPQELVDLKNQSLLVASFNPSTGELITKSDSYCSFIVQSSAFGTTEIFPFDKGMTWADWVNSGYAVSQINIAALTNNVYHTLPTDPLKLNNVIVKGTDLIQEATYIK